MGAAVLHALLPAVAVNLGARGVHAQVGGTRLIVRNARGVSFEGVEAVLLALAGGMTLYSFS